MNDAPSIATPLRPDDLAQKLATLLPARAPQDKIAVACSGGADSLALALLCAEAFPGCVTALVVDHGLRRESAAEAAQVLQWLAAKQIPARKLVWSGNKLTSGIQAAARAARYDLMTAACHAENIGVLLTAHHLDDQAETFLLALQRKSGLGGLAAIPPVRKMGNLILCRPLLDVRKSALIAALQHRGQAWIDDASNRDEKYDRVKLRQQMHALEHAGIDADMLAGAAQRLESARAFLDALVSDFAAQARPLPGGGVALDVQQLPHAATHGAGLSQMLVPLLARLLVRTAEGSYTGPAPRHAELLRLAQWAVAAGGDGAQRTLAGCRIARDSQTGENLLIFRPERSD